MPITSRFPESAGPQSTSGFFQSGGKGKSIRRSASAETQPWCTRCGRTQTDPERRSSEQPGLRAMPAHRCFLTVYTVSRKETRCLPTFVPRSVVLRLNRCSGSGHQPTGVNAGYCSETVASAMRLMLVSEVEKALAVLCVGGHSPNASRFGSRFEWLTWV